MDKYPECERCRDEDTEKCDKCTKESILNKIKLEDVIEYFKEINEYYVRARGEKATYVYEYQIYQMAIDVLKDKLSERQQD